MSRPQTSRAIRRLRPLALAVPLALAALTGQAPAQAQSQGSARVLPISIAAQPLAQALNELARQAGLDLIVQPALVAGRSAPEVSGQLSAQQALQRLLAGSGLQAVVDGNAVVIKPVPLPPPPPDSNSAPVQLPGLQVKASVEREDAHGRVNGYAARLSATATKTDTPIIETPQTISVVSAEQVLMQGSQTVSEALRYNAGITYSFDTTQDEITMRGFSLTGGGGSVYRDGSKLPLGGFNGKLEPYGLERLEVLKGASSVLYGFVQPGGLVNLVTKRPTADMAQELNLSYGSHSRQQVSADIGGAFGADSPWSWRLTGLLRRSDTFQDYVPDDRLYIAPALKWQPSAATSLTLLAHYQSDKSVAFNQLPISGLLTTNPNGPLPRSRYTGEPGDYYKPTMFSVGTLFEHAFSENLKLRNSLRYYRAHFDMHDSHGGGGGDYADDGLFRNLERQFYVRKDDSRVASADTSLEYKLDTGRVQHDLLVGLDYARQEFIGDRARYALDSLDAYNPSYGAKPGAFDNGQSWRDRSPMAGLYVQDQAKFDKRWVLVLGGRHDWWRYDSTDYSEPQKNKAFTGRAGLVYLADNGLAPFVSFSQSFEPNSERDRLGRRYVPTTGAQYELGLRYQPAGGDFMLSAAAYQLTQNDVLTPDPVNPDYSVQTGAIRSRGVEVEARGRLTAGLSVVASYAYTDARVTRSNVPEEIGNRQPQTPYNQGALWFDYRFGAFGLPGLTLGLGARTVGSTTVTPGFTIFDAALAYEQGAWRYALNINNLGDKAYADPCSFNCSWGRPREANGTVSYRW